MSLLLEDLEKRREESSTRMVDLLDGLFIFFIQIKKEIKRVKLKT